MQLVPKEVRTIEFVDNAVPADKTAHSSISSLSLNSASLHSVD